MKVTPLPAAASSSSTPISSGGDGSSAAETKPEDDFVFTWRNFVARLDICERCIFAAMIAGSAVMFAALALLPFQGEPGVSIDVLGNMILGGGMCFVFLVPVLMCYVHCKDVLADWRETERTKSSMMTAASDLV